MAFFFFLHGSICAIWTQVDSCSDVNVEDCSVCVCVCSPYFNSSLSPVYKSYVFAFASSSDSRSRSGHINNAAKAGLCFIRQTVAVLFHHLQHVNNVSLFVFFFYLCRWLHSWAASPNTCGFSHLTLCFWCLVVGQKNVMFITRHLSKKSL